LSNIFSESGRYLGYKPSASSLDFKWISYAEASVIIKELGSFLSGLNLKVEQEKSFVGFYSKNRPEVCFCLKIKFRKKSLKH
jgi:hypothetical protein